MKKSKILFVLAALAITSCGGKTTTSSNSNNDDELTVALKAMGNNYTTVFDTHGDDSWHNKMRFGDGFFAFEMYEQVSGYAKVASDDNKYHSFDHYHPERINEYDGEYFILKGRVDYTDEDLLKDSSLTSYFDSSKFELKENGVYHSDDEETIANFMDVAGTAFAYHMFGSGSDGVEITLENGKVSEINYYGVGDEEGFTHNKLYATITFDDVGTTTDSILTNYISNEENIPEPNIDDSLLAVGRDGHNLYEGFEYRFVDFAISDIIGEEPEFIGLTSENGYYGVQTSEVEKFGDAYENFLKLVSFTGTLSSENGHTVITDIKDVEFGVDELDWIPGYYIEGSESYYYDFGDWEYGVRHNGLNVSVDYLTFEGGEVSSSKGTESVLNFSYVYCGQKYILPAYFVEGASEDIRNNWLDFASDEEVTVGSTVLLNNVMFAMENGSPRVYISETSSFEKGVSFNDLCNLFFGTEIPLYSGFIGLEFFYDMPMQDEAGNYYQGLIAVADVKEDKVNAMGVEYSIELEQAGFSLITKIDDEDGSSAYFFGKDGIQVIFSSPIKDGNYYFATIQIADTNNILDIGGDDEDYADFWVGRFEATTSTGRVAVIDLDYYNAYIDGDEYEVYYTSTQACIETATSNWIINYDMDSETYSGAIWTDDEPSDFVSVVRLS